MGLDPTGTCCIEMLLVVLVVIGENNKRECKG